MEPSVIEANYPLYFRRDDAKTLGEHLKLRHSVEVVGLKRVGISNFLRFFLYHKDLIKTYINRNERHLFIAVDLNDLIERELFPFWILTFKRLVDGMEQLTLSQKVKRDVATLFLESIQSQDLFMTAEHLRDALKVLVKNDILPTIFFIRFDRMRDVINPEFFANLQGLKDATSQKLSYVFTSYRSLDELSPEVFSRASLSVFSHLMYIKPAKASDIEIIFETFDSIYNLSPRQEVKDTIIQLSGGHVQYLQLSLILLNEKKDQQDKKADQLVETILKDERIALQSEEIWDSLSKDEQDVLLKIHKEQNVKDGEKTRAKYLWLTGLVVDKKGKDFIFSPLLEYYLDQKIQEKKDGEGTIEFTKKEHLLFTFLNSNLGNVCEREKIIENVWPEYQEYGVSDWTIDRLTARLRDKLKRQKSKYVVVTIKTRGYKLVEG